MEQPSSALIVTGQSGMPKVCLAAPDGARAEIYLHGAHITSWLPAGGHEKLFLSRTSDFRPMAAIRGGVPVIFPQFGSLGPLTKHGFVRLHAWEISSLSGDKETSRAIFRLKDNESTRMLWPHAFQIELGVTVGGIQLEITLRVINTSEQPFSFTAALHTYLRVDDIRATVIEGLHGYRYHDTVNCPSPADWIEKVQTDPEVYFPGEVDRVYHNISRSLTVREPNILTRITAEGFPDAVIWNPGSEKASRLADLEPDGYQCMVCVEAAIAGAVVKLEPGEIWQGVQNLSAIFQVEMISSP